MDMEIRGVISKTIDSVYEHQNMLGTVNWIREADDRVRSPEDLAQGYVLGALMNIADGMLERKKLMDKVNKMSQKKLEKKIGREEAKKFREEQRRMGEERRAKGGRRLKAQVTEEETEEIRDMLIPMIARFREKIRQEEAVRRAHEG